METVSFYFDPLCPWCWITAEWIREVRAQKGITVEWKLFSLAVVNELGEERYVPDRIAALARREGGNEAIDKAYLALGQLIHGQGVKVDPIEDFVQAANTALEAAGLGANLARRALDDKSTQDEVVAEHEEGVRRFGAFGVPWLVLEGQEFGFFGPVIGELLKGEAAIDLWDHTRWVLSQPYLYEYKRGGRKLPPLRTP